MKKISKELGSIFKCLYKDSILGRITAEQFQTLSGNYTQEVEILNKPLPEKETAIQKLREQVSDTGHFISIVRRYTDIQAGAASAVHSKDRGTRGREVEQAHPTDGGDSLQRHWLCGPYPAGRSAHHKRCMKQKGTPADTAEAISAEASDTYKVAPVSGQPGAATFRVRKGI